MPNIALTQAGKIHALRLEHVWVEAYVDYHPARGAKHLGGVSEGDTWVAMDPAFKQYRFNPGMDLAQLVPFDAQAFLDAAKEGATINETEGWVQNLNQSKVQDALNAYQAKLKAAIDAQKPNATVGDVLGIIATDPDQLPYLSGSSPYTIKTIATRMSELPGSLRHHFRYRLFRDDFAYRNDSPAVEYQAPTAALAGKKITLAWVAATEDDQKAIEALLPKPHPDGTPIQPEELPQGLPASIRLKLEIRVNGETQATGPALTAGSEPLGAGAFTNAFDLTTWDETTDLLVAGQQSALGLSVQGVSKTQLDTLKTRLEETKAKLEAAQAAPKNQRAQILQGLTAEHLTGDMLTANIWSYFAALQGQGFLASTQAAMFDRPGMSYGLFHALATPSKLYGQFTTGVKFQGVMMDIGHLRHLRWVKNDDPQAAINSNPNLTANGKTAAHNRWVAYNRMRGQYASALEGGIPERMFIDRTQCRYVDTSTTPPTVVNPNLPDCPKAISAASAIAIAQAQGQKIFTISAKNADKAIPMLQHRGSVIEEIRQAIAAGKEVTIHEKAITESGWSGAGYAVVDPETGAGAYLIEGGARGAWWSHVGLATANLAAVCTFTSIMAATGVLALSAFAGIMVWISLLVAVLAAVSFLLAHFAGGGIDYNAYGSFSSALPLIVNVLFIAGAIALPAGSLAQLALVVYVLFTSRSGGPGR